MVIQRESKSTSEAEHAGNLSQYHNVPGAKEIELDLIDEDPNQPRTEFDESTLKELANTIKLRGVKTPISVRVNPKNSGRFIINHGARRVRASKLAGKTTIPAFIDPDYNEEDQVIENLHRDNLTAREIADFIGRQLARGKTHKVIAQTIGKSRPFVTMHAALLDLPAPVADVFNSGRCRDVTLIVDLVRAFHTNEEATSRWLADESQEINRESVRTLRNFLDHKKIEMESHTRELNFMTFDKPDIESENSVDSMPDAKVASDKAIGDVIPEKLLDQVYSEIRTHRKPTLEIITKLKAQEKKLIKDHLFAFYTLGENSHDVEKFIINALIDRRFSGKGSGAFHLIAFLHGAIKRKFDISDIIDSIGSSNR